MAKKKNKSAKMKKPHFSGSGGFQMLERANRYLQQGKLHEARDAYLALIKKNPQEYCAMENLAVVLYNLGEAEEALCWMEKIEAIKDTDAKLLLNMGRVLASLGRVDEALEKFHKTTQKNPEFADGWIILADYLYSLHRYSQAAENYARAYKLNPDEVRLQYQQACSLQEAHDYVASALIFREICKKNPDNFKALCALGMSLVYSGNITEGLSCVERSLEICSDDPLILFNAGNAYYQNKLPEKAKACFEKVLQGNPDNVEALIGFGKILIDESRLEEARGKFSRAIEVAPDYYSPYAAMGFTYHGMENKKALEWYNKALEINPGADDVLTFVSAAYQLLGEFEKSVQTAQKALELNPQKDSHYFQLGNVLSNMGMVPEALGYIQKSVQMSPENSKYGANFLLDMNYVSNSRKELYDLHRQWENQYVLRGNGYPSRPEKKSPDKKKLRVGFLSPDFRVHSVAFFFEPLAREYNRENFEFYCYSNVKKPDRMTNKLRSLVDGWRDVPGMGDSAIADLVTNDGIDILVDLAGHTGNSKPLVYALRPAPVIATWLGYPNTLGMSCIDWRLVDEITDPVGSEDFSAERILRLPGGFHCYQPPDNCPDPAVVPSVTNGKVTFGSFNNCAKINDLCLDLWCEVLRQLPQSRLVLKSLGLGDPMVNRTLLERFSKRGIDTARITTLHKTKSVLEHLQCYSQIDIALDTFPYNGTTTTFEALWMGVPVVSLCGDTHAARVSASILHHLGVDNLVASNHEEFANICTALAADENARMVFRSDVRKGLAACALMNAIGFARKFEDALRYMWQETK